MATILIAIAAVTAYVDPFFHYHKPFAEIPYSLNNQTYQNPGIARHFDYDALITGTSMTENFQTSYFAEVLGVNAIKVSYSGGRSKNMNIIIEKALESNPNLRTVFLGLDLYMLETKDINETRNPLPGYLYNANPFDDVSYLFNKDVLFNRVRPSIMGALKDAESTPFDSYSYWHNSYTFSQYTVIGSNLDRERSAAPSYSPDEAIQIADNNLRQNILPLIDAYPDTKFVIFYPPYSILYWYLESIDHKLGILEHSAETLLPYNNVELFCFQNNADIVTNLYNYKDYTHYSADINKYMVDCFNNGTHRLTPENYEVEIEKMRDLAENFDFGVFFGTSEPIKSERDFLNYMTAYFQDGSHQLVADSHEEEIRKMEDLAESLDYSAFFKESNPFIRENNFLNYLDKLNNRRYIAFIAAQSDVSISAPDIFGDQYERFGLTGDRYGFGYIAIINEGQTIYQMASDDAIAFLDLVDNLQVSLLSEKRNDTNYVEITLNEVRYTTNQAGVNIVVYDKELKRVIDNIAVNIENGSVSRK